MQNRLKDILFPRRCVICDTALTLREAGICSKCIPGVRYVNEPVCTVCGRPLPEPAEYCDECKYTGHIFKAGRFPLSYEYISESVYKFKYMNRPEYAGFYADAVCKKLSGFIEAISPDGLVPVPLHKKRLIKRGYNQAEVLAHEISLRTGVPVYSDIAQRIKNTVPQKKFARRERRLNVKKAFIVWENGVKLSKVIVIDDIFTTGSTIDALSYELKKAGAGDIYFITITAAGT